MLPNIGGPHLAPLALSISSEYQSCVDAGAMSADVFFENIATVGLYDHIACSMQVFISSTKSSVVTAPICAPTMLKSCVDAFAAGYLGRVQQELQMFQDAQGGGSQSVVDGGIFSRDSCCYGHGPRRRPS